MVYDSIIADFSGLVKGWGDFVFCFLVFSFGFCGKILIPANC